MSEEEQEYMEKFLVEFTGSGHIDVHHAIEILRDAGISDILPELRFEIQEEIEDLGVSLSNGLDICYSAYQIVKNHAQDSLVNLLGDQPQFDEYYNYFDSQVSFDSETLDKLNDAIVEKIKDDPKYRIENDPDLNAPAKYLILNDTNFDFNDCIERARQENSNTLSM